MPSDSAWPNTQQRPSPACHLCPHLPVTWVVVSHHQQVFFQFAAVVQPPSCIIYDQNHLFLAQVYANTSGYYHNQLKYEERACGCFMNVLNFNGLALKQMVYTSALFTLIILTGEHVGRERAPILMQIFSGHLKGSLLTSMPLSDGAKTSDPVPNTKHHLTAKDWASYFNCSEHDFE